MKSDHDDLSRPSYLYRLYTSTCLCPASLPYDNFRTKISPESTRGTLTAFSCFRTPVLLAITKSFLSYLVRVSRHSSCIIFNIYWKTVYMSEYSQLVEGGQISLKHDYCTSTKW